MTGADSDELDRLGGEVTGAARRLVRTRTTVGRSLQAAPWHGRNADRFRERWASEYGRSLAEAASFLDQAAGSLHRNAEEQRAASSAGGGGAPGGSGALRDGGDYEQLAFARAGIDPDSWNPSNGVDGNRATIEAVYAYYEQLYRDHPYMLWAGMAGLIGPSFFGGFLDLDMFADMVRDARRIVKNPALLAALPPNVAAALRALAELEDGDIEQEFRWYEYRLLAMQKEIFLDQATQHEAYRVDGMTGVERLFADGMIDRRTLKAWQMIDEGRRSGDQDLIRAGNEQLLYREQHDIISDDYDEMFARKPTGPAVTYLMTVVGQPSVPGAGTFADRFPLDVVVVDGPDIGPDSVGVRTPDLGGRIPSLGFDVDNPVDNSIVVRTPLPSVNVADFDSRWDLIENDTLPTYLDMPRSDVLDELDRPFAERVEENRMKHRADDIVGTMLTDWQLIVRSK